MILIAVTAARRRIASFRAALLSPSAEDIALALPELMEAAGQLGALELELRRGAHDHHEILTGLKALKDDLRMVRGLIDHGAEFYRGWAKLLGAAAGGYTPWGEAAPLAPSAAVSVHG